MPFLYGGMMAAVAYLLFMAGILTGDSGGGLLTTNVFPNFSRTRANVMNKANENDIDMNATKEAQDDGEPGPI